MPLQPSDYDQKFIEVGVDESLAAVLERLRKEKAGDDWDLFVTDNAVVIGVLPVSSLPGIQKSLGQDGTGMSIAALKEWFFQPVCVQKKTIGVGQAKQWAEASKAKLVIVMDGTTIVGRLPVSQRGTHGIPRDLPDMSPLPASKPPPPVAEGEMEVGHSPTSFIGIVQTVLARFKARKSTPKEVSSSAPQDQIPKARYLNARFASVLGDNWIDDTQPLVYEEHKNCRVGVNVGPFCSPGEPGPAVDIADELYNDKDLLELTVVARSTDMDVRPMSAPLPLPRFGTSPWVYFDVELGPPEVTSQHIDIDLLYGRDLIQSRRLVVQIVDCAGDALPNPMQPAQSGYTTFARTTRLDRTTLLPLQEQPSRLTIIAQPSDSEDKMLLVFYSAADPDESLGCREAKIDKDELFAGVDKLRVQLEAMDRAYKGGVGGDPETMCASLGPVAYAGWSLYQELVRGAQQPRERELCDKLMKLEIEPNQVLQVAPLYSQLGVPWEALYERPIESFREDRITLCDNWLQHGPKAQDCKGFGHETVLCPYGFWGFRYVLEQLPYRLRPGEELRDAGLTLSVRNQLPLRFKAVVHREFASLPGHLAQLAALTVPKLGIDEVDTIDTLKAALGLVDPADIIYVYAHGGFVDNEATLIIGPLDHEDKIRVGELRAWRGIDLSQTNALVIFNACKSAAYKPNCLGSLLEFFMEKGATGVVGTQCSVQEELADAFILNFFRAFFSQKSLGQSLFDARWDLLRHQNESGKPRPDPRGLIYSLFAPAAVTLAQPMTLSGPAERDDQP